MKCPATAITRRTSFMCPREFGKRNSARMAEKSSNDRRHHSRMPHRCFNPDYVGDHACEEPDEKALEPHTCSTCYLRCTPSKTERDRRMFSIAKLTIESVSMTIRDVEIQVDASDSPLPK
jgi:hypothetical protein